MLRMLSFSQIGYTHETFELYNYTSSDAFVETMPDTLTAASVHHYELLFGGPAAAFLHKLWLSTGFISGLFGAIGLVK